MPIPLYLRHSDGVSNADLMIVRKTESSILLFFLKLHSCMRLFKVLSLNEISQ